MRILILFLFSILATQSHAREAIWIEGEDSVDTDFNGHNWYTQTDLDMTIFSPGVPGESPGNWLGHYGGEEGGDRYAAYTLEVTEGGAYAIWIRSSNYAAGVSFSIDGGDALPLPYGENRELMNAHVNRAHPNAGSWIDIRFVDWFFLGEYDLEPGEHELRINSVYATQRNGNSENSFAIDAITAVNFDWGPSGAMQPRAEPGEDPGADVWFPFQQGFVQPGESEIDRSEIIEAPAGTHGPLQRDGANYRFEDGTPVKFWGTGTAVPSTEAAMQAQARFLRRMGINMIRLHTVRGILGPLVEQPGGGGLQLNPEKLDHLDRYFAALKAEGIYSTWSIFWMHEVTQAEWLGEQDMYDDLPDRGDGKATLGWVNVSEGIQDTRWNYLRQLMEHENPYTGTRYADDPALAVLEVQNEDNIFGTILNAIHQDRAPLHLQLLRRGFAEWVRNHYADNDALMASWGEGLENNDAYDAEELVTYSSWQMHANDPFFGQSGDRVFYVTEKRPRMGDYTRYVAEMQRDVFVRRKARLQEVGFGGIVMSTAWRPGGESDNAAVIYADAGLDAIDRHGYWGGIRYDANETPRSDYQLSEAAFSDNSLMDLSTWYSDGRQVGLFGRGFEQVEDLPFSMTEWAHRTPNRWRAEAAPIYALYGMGLQGWDQSYHFANGRGTDILTQWNGPYAASTPIQMGQFPALATAVHQGHIDEAPIVAARRLTMDQAFAGYNVLTHPDEVHWEGAEDLRIPSEIFGLGRIVTAIGDDVGPIERSDWTAGWSAENQTVTSVTEQLHWDYGNRYFEVRAAKTQGVVGFVGGRTYTLPSATIEVDTAFASLLLTALDNRPISESSKVLVTALAQETLTGTVIEGQGDEARLVSKGAPPLLLEPVQATIGFETPFESAEVLDHHGRRTGRALEADGDGNYRIDGRYATLYYLLEREAPEEPDPGAGGAGGSEPGAGGAGGGNSGMGGTGGEAQPAESAEDDGCDCRVGVTQTPSSALWMMLLALWPLRRRRRR